MSLKEKLRELAAVDLFKEAVATDAFVGRPFYFDFSKMKISRTITGRRRSGASPPERS